VKFTVWLNKLKTGLIEVFEKLKFYSHVWLKDTNGNGNKLSIVSSLSLSLFDVHTLPFANQSLSNKYEIQALEGNFDTVRKRRRFGFVKEGELNQFALPILNLEQGRVGNICGFGRV
jgi:hypothetical protein